MKSLLVDALRQANSPESLSDSGSFETTDESLPETANDEVVDVDELQEHIEEDLELLATGVFETGEWQQHTAAPDEDPVAPDVTEPHAEVVAGALRAPLMARIAPILCCAIAFVSAVAWIGWRHYETQFGKSGFAATEAARPEADANDALGGTLYVAGAERFPFIDPGAPDDRQEGGE